ncbi:MAG: cadmium-translocating P-type ATPase [Candidatus Methanomethylophilaceae archaeon]|nr:cadmium-translocating P-type ATPase [Candidatus Methanomethylophilaceae archaeon]
MSAIKRFNDLLAGLPMTIVGGIFLVASFVLPRIGHPEGELLAWVCVFICGIPLLYLSVWRIIYNKGISKISSALLITIAMFAAIFIGDLFAAGEVAFIMEIGAILEDMTTERAKKGLKNLIALVPETARRIEDGKENVIPVTEVRIGDIIRIVPGETVPVDGKVLSGETTMDQSVMTGESLPVDKAPGDQVFSGTVNRFGSVDIEATKEGEDSSLQKLIRMVEDADKNQAHTQRIADKWASWLVPVAALIAVAAYFVTGEIVRAVTVLVVFCPCALILATPTAIMAAIGQATKHGVIIKSGVALENMGAVDTIAFDKTGTLTYGRLEVSDIVPMGGVAEDELLTIAASVERRSEHPMGKAIVAEAEKRGKTIPDCEGFKMSAGKGVEAVVNGSKCVVGNPAFVFGDKVPAEVEPVLSTMRSEGKASVVVQSEGRTVGVLGLSDVLRPEAKEVISELNGMGVKTVLLTGDHREAADYFASKAGVTEVRAELLPEDKLSSISEMKSGSKVCMIGDGVNDAPALKAADVGVAMGAMGSDIAVEAADVALMTDDITKVPYLKWLSNAAVKTIRVAITISMTINFFAIIASVTGVLNPTTGALVHNAGSCFVVLLAALLYDRKYPGDKKAKAPSAPRGKDFVGEKSIKPVPETD